MFDWENRLKELSDYYIGFEIKQGYYHISIVFDQNWKILEPDNKNIYVKQKNGIWHYIASTDSTTIAEMFKTVDATIEYNMDLQKKLILFKKKTEELQEIFAKETLEVLETIEFKYGLKKEKLPKKKKEEQPKKKRGRKSKKQEEKSKSLTEEYYNSIKKLENENNEDKIEETETINEYIDNDEEVVMPQDGFFEELERK